MADLFDIQLANLVKLASKPAWKAYAWNRAKELERCHTGMWEGMAAELQAAMQASPAAPAVAA